ncbi:nucleoside-diphosphate kinase [Thermovenabulum gondwanense]|uniref:Nucleoside diphosphate kinase n=1 Tax=Thermovenabulum gondwanense TaxID=520767 RepID=A0A162M692_9FIRM|nr:nucleoside-diphosphate kinase [Thermovenabulum gondwanense]KYO64294.1 Nucleoside diphosphate kinase [Thermovenabulum gondwanense]
MEKTFVMLKPDAVKRGLVGSIIKRYEQKGLKILALKMLQVTEDLAEKHYEEHRDKPFYRELVNFITSGPVVAMILEGPNAIKLVRLLNGATKAEDALPGTIRGDYALTTQENLVHASDSSESARREIALWFPELSF